MKFFRDISSFHLDWTLVFLFTTILGAGLVTLASASFASAHHLYGDELYFINRQFFAILIGLICLFVAIKIPIDTFEKYSGVFLVASLVLLVLVFVPGVGQLRNGSLRWINLGFISLQSSELAKIFLGIYFCSYAYRHHIKLRTTFLGLIRPLLVLLVSGALLYMEPDFGSTIVMTSIILLILYIGGARYFHIFILGSSLTVMFYYLTYLEPYRVKRIFGFLEPWADPFDTGFQLTQSLMAIGSGGISGLGLGNSVQKLHYLPEAHTDFVFSVFAEEFGFIGCTILVALFTILVFKILSIAKEAFQQGQHFHGLLSFFLGIHLASSFFLNIAVSIGLVPTKGLVLPFFSYGRSSLIVSIFCMGLALRIAHEVNKFNDVMNARKAYRSTLIGEAL